MMVVSIIALVCVVFTIAYIDNRRVQKEKNKISIKESLDLAQIPVVTLYDCDTKLNFLLDTGSSQSHISKSASIMLMGTPVDTEYTITTSSGCNNISKSIDSILKYKKQEFKATLLVNEGLDDAFEQVKSENGIQLHGILGSDFLKEHKYVLDFDELVAYSK